MLIGGGAGVGLVVAFALWPRHLSSDLTVQRGEQAFGNFLKTVLWSFSGHRNFKTDPNFAAAWVIDHVTAARTRLCFLSSSSWYTWAISPRRYCLPRFTTAWR